MKTIGIHHITAITADPQKNLDFYEGFLGQRLIKKTVNFDDPSAYHLYYGDMIGSPGTIMTFFYWRGISQGRRGTGEVSDIYYGIKPSSLAYWKARAASMGVEVLEEILLFGDTALIIQDPDGLRIGLIVAEANNAIVPWNDGTVLPEHALQGFYGALIAVSDQAKIINILTDGFGYKFIRREGSILLCQAERQPGKFLVIQELANLSRARQGAGSVHHIAFQATNDFQLQSLRAQVNDLGISSTSMIDRKYFHSTYFMTPAGALFEIATNDIGFTIDEPVAELGENLKLPSQYELYRTEIEQNLPKLTLHRTKRTK